MIESEEHCDNNKTQQKDQMTNIQQDNKCCVNQNISSIKENLLKSELYLQQPVHIMAEQVQSQINKQVGLSRQQRKLNEQGVQTMQMLELSNHYDDGVHEYYNEGVHQQTQQSCERPNQKQHKQESRIKIDFLDLGQIKQCEVAMMKNSEQAVIQQSEPDKMDGLNVEQSEEGYQRIIDELNDKLARLKRQYDLLIGLRRQQNEQIIIKDLPSQIIIKDLPSQIINSPITPPNLTINEVYHYQITINKNKKKQHLLDIQQQYNGNNQEEQKQSQQMIEHNTHNNHHNSNDQPLTTYPKQTTNTPQQQTLNSQQKPLQNYQYQHAYQHQLVSPYLFQTMANEQVERQRYSLGILSRSVSNLATLKQSIDTLSYERIKQLMNLQWLTSKISFKQKHYPSQSSTSQQLKLYAKRLLKLLINSNPINTNPINNNIGSQDSSFHQLYGENDIEYDQTDQYVSFFTKQIKNLIIICYYNKTIYIGPFTSYNPSNQLIRQGHAIQIRQNKYVYQGQFHADKKHGYGYIHFLNTKNQKVYSGYWIDGFIDGTGKQIYHTGQTYQGDFKLGLRDGVGLLYYQNDKSHTYQGQFYDGYKHGNGLEIFINGDTYTGSYIKDKFYGQGQYTWKNGTIYKGTFHQGLKHGQGLLILTNGKQSLKYYDHNRQINILNQDDKKTIRSSAISNITLSKTQQKHSLIQEKPKSSKNYKSQSCKSLFSAKSLSKDKSIKQNKSKKTIAQLMKQKQLDQDLKNLNTILKPTTQQSSKKIFSIRKLSQTQNAMGKMYNISDRPTMRISEQIGIDMLRLGRTGRQGKSLISFDQWERLQQPREQNNGGLGYNMTNFQQF